MSLLGNIVGRVVMQYEARTEEARAAVKGLAGEQKKAAKEAADGLKAQTDQLKTWHGEFVKGAAIIGGALLVAQNGLKALREEQRLTTGAAGVDIDRLSTAYGGLKTRMDLLALAQAGHQGAWKLTTGQIETVIEGMRALEKKGFDTQQVFDKFTDVLKKGKTEGLDDFGLAVKSTGDQAKDLQVLMRALGKEVSDVGGNFDKAGDATTRSMVKMEDGLTRIRTAAGTAADAFVDLGIAIGNSVGRLVAGDIPEVSLGGIEGQASAYASILAGRRRQISGQRNRGAFAIATGADSWFTFADRQLFTGTSDADRQEAMALATFKGNLRKAQSGRGPLATASPEEFAQIVSGLPQDWRLVDESLGPLVDNLGVKLEERFNVVGKQAIKGMLAGITSALDKNREETRRGKGGGRGGGRRASLGPGLIFGAAHGAFDALSAAADYETAQNDAAAQAQADAMAAYREKMSQRFADAQMVQDIEKFREDLSKEKGDTYLERTFGTLKEFDKYGVAFGVLKDAVMGGMQAWIAGSESVGAAVRRSIAQSLGGYAIEMAGMALVAGAHGVYHLTNPLTAAQGLGELASAAKYAAAASGLAVLARLASPATGPTGGASGGGSSARAGRNQDHRGDGGSGGVHQPGALQSILVIGNAYDDDSRRVRERAAVRALTRTSTAYRPPGGTSP